MAKEVAALCSYAGVMAEREPYGLFGHLLPQEALSSSERNQVSQVLRPDLRMELPKRRIRPPDRVGEGKGLAQPAQVSTGVQGPTITEIKVISKGARPSISREQTRPELWTGEQLPSLENTRLRP